MTHPHRLDPGRDIHLADIPTNAKPYHQDRDEAEAQLIAADNFLSTSRWAEETYGRDAIEALVNLYAQTNQTELLEKHRERLAAIASEE